MFNYSILFIIVQRTDIVTQFERAQQEIKHYITLIRRGALDFVPKWPFDWLGKGQSHSLENMMSFAMQYDFSVIKDLK